MRGKVGSISSLRRLQSLLCSERVIRSTDRRMVEFAFAWDGKSTMAKSITIDRPMLRKATEQAGAERPMIGVRFYDDERLRGFEDWVLVKAADMAEVVERANDGS